MTTKISEVVTYDEEKPSVKLHNPLMTWSREVTWQIKHVISPLAQWV